MRTIKYLGPILLILLPLHTGALAGDGELSGAEIRARVVGNTIIGIEDGKYYEEFLQPNGGIAGRNNRESYRGWWRIDGNQLCLAYDPDDDQTLATPPRNWDCSTLALSGDRLTWKDDGVVAYGRLFPGRIFAGIRALVKPEVQAARP